MLVKGILIFVPLLLLGGWELIIRAATPWRGAFVLFVIMTVAMVGLDGVDPSMFTDRAMNLRTARLVTAAIIVAMLPLVLVAGSRRNRRVPVLWQMTGAALGGIMGYYLVVFGIFALGCAGLPEGCEA